MTRHRSLALAGLLVSTVANADPTAASANPQDQHDSQPAAEPSGTALASPNEKASRTIASARKSLIEATIAERIAGVFWEGYGGYVAECGVYRVAPGWESVLTERSAIQARISGSGTNNHTTSEVNDKHGEL